MNLTLARDLATPRTPADRRRARLTTTGLAGCGVFALASVAILTARGGDVDRVTGVDGNGYRTYETLSGPLSDSLAPFLVQPGLRSGSALAVALVVLPFLVFAWQAVRIGSAARERRLAALSLAGATRRDLRTVAVLEGTRAAGRAAVWAGAAYLLLWLVVGIGFPKGTKLLPPLQWEVLAGWPVLAVLLVAVGALAGAISARPASVTPLGLIRRARRGLGPVNAILPVLALIALFGGRYSFTWGVYMTHQALIYLLALVVLGLTVGPWLTLAAGVLATRSGDLVTVMAGRRLLADVRSPGRLSGVLLAMGTGFTVIGSSLVTVPRQLVDANGDLFPEYNSEIWFYVAGLLLVAALLTVACVVAVWSMVAGATEQVLENRRATAVVVALAASPATVLRIVRRQMLLITVPPTVIGAGLAWSDIGRRTGGQDLPGLALGLVVAVLAAVAGALVATAAVAPAVRETAGPENLRVA